MKNLLPSFFFVLFVAFVVNIVSLRTAAALVKFGTPLEPGVLGVACR